MTEDEAYTMTHVLLAESQRNNTYLFVKKKNYTQFLLTFKKIVQSKYATKTYNKNSLTLLERTWLYVTTRKKPF